MLLELGSQRAPVHHSSAVMLRGRVSEGSRRDAERVSAEWRLAENNKGSHSFNLPPTNLSTSGMSHTCLYSPAAEHHRTLAGTHFPSG